MIDANIPDLPDDIRAMFEAERRVAPLPHAMRRRLAASLVRASSRMPWISELLSAARRGAPFVITFAAGVSVGAGLEHRHHASSAANGAFARAVVPTIPTLLPTVPAGAAAGGLRSTWHEVAVPAQAEPALVARPTRARSPGAPVVSTLAVERALLETAREAMARSRWDEAAAALDAHEKDYAAGQLIEERDSLRVALLVHQGRASEAHVAAARFERLHPQSVFVSAVRAGANSVTERLDAGQAPHEPKGE